jgi:hypothetical protein
VPTKRGRAVKKSKTNNGCEVKAAEAAAYSAGTPPQRLFAAQKVPQTLLFAA